MESAKEIMLSFIVPIYNVEQYLCKCVDSLLHQDYDNYEIILVDDGSPDNCPAICDEYASKHENIRVVHRANGGLSAARNTGIEAARGEYICFVDSDDYWESNVLGGLMAQIERDKLEVLRFQYRYVNEVGNEFHPYKNPKKYTNYSDEVVDGENFLNNRLGFSCYVPMFIMRRDLLAECLFTEGIYFEDTDWTPLMLMMAKRVASTNTMVYNYLWRVGSITQAVDINKKRKVLEDKIKLLYGFIEQRKMVRDDSWYKWQIAAGTMSVLGILSGDFYAERKKYICEIQQIGVFPLSTFRSNRNFRLKIMLANLSPYLYCIIFNRVNKR